MKKLLLLLLLLTNAVFAQPGLVQLPDMYVCSDNNSPTIFNLTFQESILLAPSNPDLYIIKYYTSLQDAQNSTNNIAQPQAFTIITPAEQTIYVTTIEIANPGNHLIAYFDVVASTVVITPLHDIELCSGFMNPDSSYYTLDTGLSAQSHYFTWQHNGITIPGATQSSYTPLLPGEYTVFVQNTSGCSATASATVTMSGLSDTPVSISSYGQTVTINVMGTANYLYRIDLFGPYQSSNIFTDVPYGTRDIFIQDGCGNVIIISYYIDTLTPLEIGNPENLVKCVPYGSSIEGQEFDLTYNDDIVLNGLNPDDYIVEYYNGDSFATHSLITNPENYQIIIDSQALRVKVTSNSNPDLFGTAMFTLNLLPTAIITPVAPLIIEDADNNGIGIADLTSKYNEILNGQPASITTIQYFTSEADASQNINPIANPGAFETGAATIYYRLLMTICSSIGSFNIIPDSELTENQHIFTSLQYYPNPVTDYITFTNNTAINSIEMYNQLGQKVLSNEYNSNIIKADISGLANGLYMIKIKSGSDEKTIKVIKE